MTPAIPPLICIGYPWVPAASATLRGRLDLCSRQTGVGKFRVSRGYRFGWLRSYEYVRRHHSLRLRQRQIRAGFGNGARNLPLFVEPGVLVAEADSGMDSDPRFRVSFAAAGGSLVKPDGGRPDVLPALPALSLQMLGEVLVHLEHGYPVLAKDLPELVVGQDLAAVLRVL
jgi:hypothetical protein